MFPVMTPGGHVVHLSFQPSYTWSLEEITNFTGSTSLFMDFVEAKTISDRILIQIDSVPMAYFTYRMSTHMVVLIKGNDKGIPYYEIYNVDRIITIRKDDVLDDKSKQKLNHLLYPAEPLLNKNRAPYQIDDFNEKLYALFHPAMRVTFYEPVLAKAAPKEGSRMWILKAYENTKDMRSALLKSQKNYAKSIYKLSKKKA